MKTIITLLMAGTIAAIAAPVEAQTKRSIAYNSLAATASPPSSMHSMSAMCPGTRFGSTSITGPFRQTRRFSMASG